MSLAPLAPLKCQNLLAQHARSCITLHPVLPDNEIVGTKLSRHSFFGGTPLLPPNFEWPRAAFTPDGSKDQLQVPLVFCLQLDLSELVPFDELKELPDHGILAFFSVGDSFNFSAPEHSFVVRYFEHCEQLIAHSRPEVAGVDTNKEQLELPHLELSAQRAWSFPIDAPSYEDDRANELLAPLGLSVQVMEEIWDNLEDLAAELKAQDGIDVESNEFAERSQMLGYGHFIQGNDLQGPESTLLLTLSSFFDQAHNEWVTLYGDAGALYFALKTSDLKARAFDRVVGDMQCY